MVRFDFFSVLYSRIGAKKHPVGFPTRHQRLYCFNLRTIIFHKTKCYRRFCHPQTCIIQLMTLKHGTTIFCFHLTKVRLKIFNASTFGQFHRSSHVCTPNQLILQIENLWKKNDFPQYRVRSSKFFLRFAACGTSVSNTKTTVVPA